MERELTWPGGPTTRVAAAPALRARLLRRTAPIHETRRHAPAEEIHGLIAGPGCLFRTAECGQNGRGPSAVENRLWMPPLCPARGLLRTRFRKPETIPSNWPAVSPRMHCAMVIGWVSSFFTPSPRAGHAKREQFASLPDQTVACLNRRRKAFHKGPAAPHSQPDSHNSRWPEDCARCGSAEGCRSRLSPRRRYRRDERRRRADCSVRPWARAGSFSDR